MYHGKYKAVKVVVINPLAIAITSDGFFLTSSPVMVSTTSSPAKSLEFGFIKLLIADACLASTETILPARSK